MVFPCEYVSGSTHTSQQSPTFSTAKTRACVILGLDDVRKSTRTKLPEVFRRGVRFLISNSPSCKELSMLMTWIWMLWRVVLPNVSFFMINNQMPKATPEQETRRGGPAICISFGCNCNSRQIEAKYGHQNIPENRDRVSWRLSGDGCQNCLIDYFLCGFHVADGLLDRSSDKSR